MDQQVTTGIFTINTATHARTAISILAGKWWWMIVIPPVVAGMLATFNIAFIFAAVIWIFMLLPPAIMIAYYNCLLQPIAAQLSLPHYIIIHLNGNLTIGFPPRETSNDNIIEPDKEMIKSSDKLIEIPANAINEISESGSNILIKLNLKDISFLLIPQNSIPAEGYKILQSITP